MKKKKKKKAERSHEGEAEDTPWRHVGMAKVWAAAPWVLYPTPGKVLKNQAGAGTQLVYLRQES